MQDKKLNDEEMKSVNGGTDGSKKKLIQYPPDILKILSDPDYMKKYQQHMSVPEYGINVPRRPIKKNLPLDIKEPKENEEKE